MSAATLPVRQRRGGGGGIRRGEAASGWLFTAPVLVILGVFLLIPVLMAAWVSVSDWAGRGSPFASGVNFIGGKNYADLFAGGGLITSDFGIALKNNLWYVIFVVPIQTAVSLGLAVLVNRRIIRGRGFFRTAFYFPSVTSTVAITVLWLFLFSTTGAVNKVLAAVGITGPNWFNEPAGILHFGVDQAPSFLSGRLLGVTWWDWLGGPSVAMSAFIVMAIFTTSGTFMLLFLAALQNLSTDVFEAAEVDGANGWTRFWRVTLPQLRPTLFTVITLGLIGCWQVFDQIYTGTKGNPGKTTLTPAYLSYSNAFGSNEWGTGAAIAFVLFAIIIIFTLIQRWVLAERKVSSRRSRWIDEASARPSDVAQGMAYAAVNNRNGGSTGGL